MFKLKLSLRTYLTGLMVAVAAVPVVLLGAYLIWQGVGERQREAERNQLLADWVGLSVEAELAHQRLTLETELGALGRLTQRELGPALARTIAGPLGPVVVVDKAHRPLAGPLPPPLTRGDLTELLSKGPGGLTEPTLVSNWSRGAFWLAPVRGRDWQGYAVAAADLDQIKTMLGRLPLADGEWVALAGDDRLVMAVAGVEEQGPALLGQPVDGHLMAQLGASQTHPTPYPLEVRVGRYQADEPHTRTTILTLTIGLLALVLAVVAMGYLTRPIVRWLEGLSEAVAGADGELGLGPSTLALVPVELQRLAEGVGELLGRVSLDQQRYISASQEVNVRTARLAQASIDLVQSRATLYSVIESITNGLVLLTPDGRLRYVNQTAEALLGLQEPFYPGRLANDFYEALAAACTEPGVAQAELQQSISDNNHLPLFTLDLGGGRLRYVRCRTFAIRSNTGANLGLGHLLTDVTQEQELDRVKSELIANVSHELRTPLTSILASSSSLLRPEIRWSDEMGHEFLESIVEEAHILQDLIESLLDMSKLEAGVFHLDRTPYPVHRLFERVMTRAAVRWPGWYLRAEVEADLPLVAYDVRQLERLLLNLVENAVKYAGDRPEVTLRGSVSGGRLLLAVRDYGKGLDPVELDAIFGRFYRAEGEVAKRSRGSGLGLAICRGIAMAHGGEIWAESTPGEGTTFIVALPLEERES